MIVDGPLFRGADRRHDRRVGWFVALGRTAVHPDLPQGQLVDIDTVGTLEEALFGPWMPSITASAPHAMALAMSPPVEPYIEDAELFTDPPPSTSGSYLLGPAGALLTRRHGRV